MIRSIDREALPAGHRAGQVQGAVGRDRAAGAIDGVVHCARPVELAAAADGQRAAVEYSAIELDRAVGDAFCASEGQIAERANLQCLVGIVDRDRGRRGVPSILRSEPAIVLIASVRPLTEPVRSSVPPLAVIVPALEIEIATVPEPVTFVFAPSVPNPLRVPPPIVMPLASVSVALDARVMWPPAASVRAPVTVRSPLFTANVPVTFVPAAAAIVLVPAVVIVPALVIPSPFSCSVPPARELATVGERTRDLQCHGVTMLPMMLT